MKIGGANIDYNVLQIGGRFNAANVLLSAALLSELILTI
jgi:hypothetical protein